MSSEGAPDNAHTQKNPSPGYSSTAFNEANGRVPAIWITESEDHSEAPPRISRGSTVSSDHGSIQGSVRSFERRGQVIPQEFLCSLRLKYGKKPLPWSGLFSVPGTVDRSFDIIEQKANEALRDEVLERHELYRRRGSCSVMAHVTDHITGQPTDLVHEGQKRGPSAFLKVGEQWNEVSSLLVGAFVVKHPYERFYLEIEWEYSSLQIEPDEGQSFVDMIKSEIFKKMDRNFDGREYIPRTDLIRIMSFSCIERIITEDTSLADLSYHDKQRFVKEVQLGASRLQALCISLRIDMACLRAIMGKESASRPGKKIVDLDLPLKDKDCPDTKYEVDFSNIKLRQGGFIAHKFDKGAAHENIPKDIVLPIRFDMSQDSLDRLGSGGSGQVYRVRIDPDHHTLSNVSRLRRRSSIFVSGLRI